MDITIKQFKGAEWVSNCYILYYKDINRNCIIIDPGSVDITDYVEYIEQNGLYPEFMIITHRHFDHFAGANDFRKKYPNVRLLCSEGCNVAIQSPRLNCSALTNKLKAFVLDPAEETFEGSLSIIWNEHTISFVPTPGHTEDSISVLIDGNVFTGDALLKNSPTITKLPSGNRKTQKATELFLQTLHDYKAWPGHGEAFVIK